MSVSIFLTIHSLRFYTIKWINSFLDLIIMQIDPIQPIHVTDEYTPYSIIPMMYPTNGTLLSDWPDFLSQRTYRSVQQSNLVLHVQGVY